MNEHTMTDHQTSYPQKEMRTKDWLITLLLLAIPIVNIVLLFVWAFGGDTSQKKYYSRASLILAAIFVGLYILLFVLFMILGIAFSSNSTY
ncbi:hypothetical protein [Jeotgalibacillus aurantiacus]|uniref:hypothetical protein n=1 Tax=Jeotgalibacillus aurantiacus TaxID=2763266 RepID=UPI001D09D2D7|nr:hypothetical protein [Jeotgalibacillus aurantiacus]